MKTKWILTGCFVTLLLGGVMWWWIEGTQDQNAVQVYQDEVKTRAEILRLSPLGTSVGRARRVMEGSGFECELERIERNGESIRQLYCWRRDRVWFAPLIANEWRVGFDIGDDQMTQALFVTFGRSGL